VIDLGDLNPEQLDRLAIEIPSARLERLTLIDTPGIGSLSTSVSARTTSSWPTPPTAARTPCSI